MSFQLVPKSVTLNHLERRNGVILRCFSEFVYLPGALRKSSRSLSHLLMSSCYNFDDCIILQTFCIMHMPVTQYFRCVVAWSSGNDVGRSNDVTLRRTLLLSGWVTVRRRASQLGMQPAQFVRYSGREMSTDQSAVMLCRWRLRA